MVCFYKRSENRAAQVIEGILEAVGDKLIRDQPSRDGNFRREVDLSNIALELDPAGLVQMTEVRDHLREERSQRRYPFGSGFVEQVMNQA